MQNPKKILVIRRDNIGDLACTTPVFAALRERFPGAEIGALVNSYNAEVLLRNPNVDRLFVYQKLKHAGGMGNRFKALRQRFALIAKLRRWKPDVTILAKASYDRHGLNFARQIGAKNIIGYVPEAEGMAKGLPDICVETPDFTALHEVEAVAALLRPLGVVHDMGALQVFPDTSIESRLKGTVPSATSRVALHISAREPGRRWGEANFIGLIRHILATVPEKQIMLFWSPGGADDRHHPGDDAMAVQIIKACGDQRLIPMPTQNLSELIAGLALCDIFIGADGGAMHLAAALQKRVLALFENKPDKLKHWYPWGCVHRIVIGMSEEQTEVKNIAMEAVIEALVSLEASHRQ
jgi:heptosyltransferase III